MIAASHVYVHAQVHSSARASVALNVLLLAAPSVTQAKYAELASAAGHHGSHADLCATSQSPSGDPGQGDVLGRSLAGWNAQKLANVLTQAFVNDVNTGLTMQTVRCVCVS